MTIEFIDYSDAYFTHILKKETPAARDGKFVQIRTKDCEFIVLAPKGLAGFHAQIVERFADSRSLAGMMNKADMLYDIHEPGWWVVGGGCWQIDEDKMILKLSSGSKAYGRFDRDTLEKISLGGYRVTFDPPPGERNSQV